MTSDTLITITVSVITSGITAFSVIAYRMGRYSEKIDQLEKCDFQKRVSTLEGQYSVGNITQRKSPISLNDKGVQVLNESGARTFVDQNLTELIQRIQELGSSPTAYDVQEGAKTVIGTYRDDTRFIPLKDFAFRLGIDLSIVELTAALYLRDQSLSNFGFKHEDIDITDPTLTSRV